MTRLCVSFVFAGLALFAAAGCSKSGADSGPPPTPNRDNPPGPVHGQGIGPGLSKGVVQIYKNGEAPANLVACVTANPPAGEYWITAQGQPYPIPCSNGDWLKFVYRDSAPADTDHDGTVTCAELLACTQYVGGLGTDKVIRRVTESCEQLSGCGQ